MIGPHLLMDLYRTSNGQHSTCSYIEHEILPVTEGYRITLTYNLYHNLYHSDLLMNPVPVVDVTTSPFYNTLKAALGNPYFLCGGGVLVFACQHAYVFEEFGITWEEVVDVMHGVPTLKIFFFA